MAKLLDGVEFEGLVHFDFEMRRPTIGDNIAAVDSVGVGASELAVKMALAAQCMTKLGTIPKDAITYDLLCGLDEDEYDLIMAEFNAVKKKRKPLNPTKETSALQP